MLDFLKLVEKFVTGFHVRANADKPRDAALARKFGAKGIGLVRTEHMFFDEKRINVFREMVLSDSVEERKKALARLLPMQKADFYKLLKIMEGYPVIIRLLDAPLHEFLPHNDQELERFMQYLNAGKKGSARGRRRRTCGREARRCTSSTPCSATAGAVSPSRIPRSTRCRCGPSSRPCTP